MFKVTIYRIDSECPVVYENVKHAWYEQCNRLIISVFKEPGKPDHYYWHWPLAMISHIRVERM